MFIIYHLYIPIACHMFSVFDISSNYTFTVFLCFVIFYLPLSFLALMHFYHVFIACSIYSFRYVYHIFISYMTFMVIYYTICYVLCSCTVFMYSFHILFSCFTFHITFSFILTFQIILHSYTFSYIMSDRIISCYRTYHHIAILCFSDHNISYNLMLQNLSSHSSAMLLISYHIFSHVIFKSFILCFMPVNTKEVDIGNL